MKAKTKKRLVILLCVLVIIAALGFAAYKIAMNYIGSKAMNMLISNQLNDMLDSGEVTIDELEAIASGIETTPEAQTPPEPPAEPASSETEPENEPVAVGQEGAESPQESVKTPAVSPPKSQSGTNRGEIVQRATDKIEGSISRADKEAMARLITSRLTGADISYLSGLLKDGLTAQEISDAARLAQNRFTAEELSQVKMYWHRYKNQIKRAKG